MMSVRKLVGGMIVFWFGSSLAVAQNTLGELIDAGGKKLSKEQVVTALSGAQVAGPTTGGGQREVVFKADGSYSGNVETTAKQGFGVVGTWTVDDGGKLCTEGHQSGKRATREGGCNYYFVHLDQYYVTPSDSDRSSPVLKRTIKK
jgi:hypothetical protein